MCSGSMKNQKKLNDGAQVARKFQMGLAAACLFGALLGVVIHFPATALASMVESQTNGTIRLTQAKGSIWDGSAGVEFVGKGDGGFAWPDRWSWKWAWSSGAPELKLLVKSCAQGVVLRLGWRGVDAGPMECAVPASILSAAAGPWPKMKYGGVMIVSSDGLVQQGWNGWAMKGLLKIRLADLCVELSQACPLGSYTIDANIDAGKATLGISSMPGSVLAVSGSGAVDRAGSRVDAVAKADPKQEPGMANMLSMMGNYQAGESKISWQAEAAGAKK